MNAYCIRTNQKLLSASNCFIPCLYTLNKVTKKGQEIFKFFSKENKKTVEIILICGIILLEDGKYGQLITCLIIYPVKYLKGVPIE